MVMANDLPKIKPYDDAVDKRSKVISYKREFVENPTNEFQLKMDSNIESEIRTTKFQKALVGLFIQAYMDKSKFDYEPIEVVISKDEWISNDKNVIETFENDFEITNNETDYVRSEDIEDWIKQRDLGITMVKFGSEMKKHAILNKLENVINKYKKINGKTRMCWFGVKTITEIHDCESDEM
jgi:hypothetical protein